MSLGGLMIMMIVAGMIFLALRGSRALNRVSSRSNSARDRCDTAKPPRGRGTCFLGCRHHAFRRRVARSRPRRGRPRIERGGPGELLGGPRRLRERQAGHEPGALRIRRHRHRSHPRGRALRDGLCEVPRPGPTGAGTPPAVLLRPGSRTLHQERHLGSPAARHARSRPARSTRPA